MAGHFELTQTPEKASIRVPSGHILVNTKWRNSTLTSTLQGCVNILYEEKLGQPDFMPACHVGAVYAAEADLVNQAGVRRKLAKLRKANELQILVLVEKTPSSSQYYQALQKFVAIELGFLVTPVPGQVEAAGILAQIVQTENKLESNPFSKKRRPGNIDEALLTTMQCVPKLGAVKARKLLEHFKSLSAVNAATDEELRSVVGNASARNVRQFLDQQTDM